MPHYSRGVQELVGCPDERQETKLAARKRGGHKARPFMLLRTDKI
jgi:hypothetical protein